MTASRNDFYVTGGTLRADAPCYVERQADHELVHGLLGGEFCYVLTSRQMGKSSLMLRTAQKLREQQVHVVVLDLTAIGQNLTPEQWYDGLTIRLGRQLHLEDELEDFWQDHLRMGPCQRWFAALRDVVLGNAKKPGISASGDNPPMMPANAPTRGRIVVFIDELDAVRSLPFSTDEFFAAIRECYHRRAEDGELNRLTFCLLGVAAPYELMQDTNRTPFNIGRRIELVDFTPEQGRGLVEGLATLSAACRALDGAALISRILYWTGGHPYLTQRLFRAVGEATASGDPGKEAELIDRLCEEVFLSARGREADDSLVFVRERLLRTEADLSSVLDLYEKVLDGGMVPANDQDPLINQLQLAGVVRVAGSRLAVRNRIYEHVFDRRWVAANKPIAELEKPDGQRLRLQGTCSLGRTDTNDLVLADVKVSRRHALIQKQGQDELWLVDLGSRNGTYLNGTKLTRPMLLRDKDQIDIGSHRFHFHQPKAPRRDPGDLTTFDKTVVHIKQTTS